MLSWMAIKKSETEYMVDSLLGSGNSDMGIRESGGALSFQGEMSGIVDIAVELKLKNDTCKIRCFKK